MGPGFAFRRGLAALALALCALVPVSVAAARPGSGRPLVLDAYSPLHRRGSPFTPPVSSPSKLAPGHLYVATVRGTVSFYEAVDYVALQAPWQIMCGAPQRAPMFSSAGGSGRVGDDAEFIFALPAVGHSCGDMKLPRPYPNFQADAGLGWTHPNAVSRQGRVELSRSHTYEFALTGTGRPVSFRLADPDTRDNYGSFDIYLRSAVGADCAGRGHLAFGLSRMACLAATADSSEAPSLPAIPQVVALDQAPVARVLRSSDVPGVNQELPSGALTVTQFAGLDNKTRAAAAAERRLLLRCGFRSAAISGFAAPGQPTLRSAAVELSSPRRALAALTAESALAAGTQAPARTTVLSGSDAGFAHGSIITFTPISGGLGGLELLASAGNYLYTLTALEKPDTVSREAEEKILGELIARGDPADTRARLLRLTPTGGEFLARALSDVETADEDYFAPLGELGMPSSRRSARSGSSKSRSQTARTRGVVRIWLPSR